MGAQPISLRVVRSERPHEAVDGLRAQLRRMQAEPARQPLVMPDVVRSLVEIRTGGAYRVDDQSLALTLLSAVSAAGNWIGAVGLNDVGWEAAAEAGLDLSRAVTVPDPGDLWLEAVTALVDVLPVLWVRPPRPVSPRLASTVAARLRKREATLFIQGDWPGAEAQLWVEQARWVGVGDGSGRLQERSAHIACRRGTAPVRYAPWPPALEETRRDLKVRAG